MIDCFSIPELIATRSSQTSFHVASEPNVRIEFRNMKAGDAIERFTYGGEVVLTCFVGAFTVNTDDELVTLRELSFAVIRSGTPASIVCAATGTLQLVWTPGHAGTVKDTRKQRPHGSNS
jgi:hypothetical protein